jgi:hypothetical protein
MLTSVQKKNMDNFGKAIKNGQIALVECLEIVSSKRVPLVCAVNRKGEDFSLIPFARLLEGDPYLEFLPPDPNNPDQFLAPEES